MNDNNNQKNELESLFNEINNYLNSEKENVEEKKEEINPKKSNKRKKKSGVVGIIICAIMDVLALVCLFLMYGPISYFRNLWVTSAMTTMTHKYLAYVFFNQESIDEIMANNVVIEVEEETNTEEIKVEEETPIVYESEYDRQVLTKDEGNDLYKVIEVSGDGYVGHLLVVYDPSKIKLVMSSSYPKYGETLENMISKNGGIAGINASGFSYNSYSGYSIVGALIKDGQIINEASDTGWGGGIIGFTNDNVLVLSRGTAEEAVAMGVRDAVSFGPFLIVNGQASEFKGNGGYGLAPRTAIGQRKDGIVLMLVIDGRRVGHSIGVDMAELTNILLNYGAYNAANLDGGGSSSMVVNGETISVAGGYGYEGERYLAHGWAIIP